MKITRAGAITMSVGVAAIVLSCVLGAGPCNATASGVILMMLGLLAVPVGAIIFAIGYFVKRSNPA